MNVEPVPRFRSRAIELPGPNGGYGVTKSKCIGIGLAFGLIIGVALKSYGLGILVGTAIGGLICFVQQRRQGSGQP